MNHSAKLSKSDRLQRAFDVLLDGKWHTTRNLIRTAHICATNSVISELRQNGIDVLCERRKNLWYYKLDAK